MIQFLIASIFFAPLFALDVPNRRMGPPREVDFIPTSIDASGGPRAGQCVEVQNTPMIKNQLNANMCYAFSVSSLLEHHRCEVMKIRCDSPSEQISPLHVASKLGPENMPELRQTGNTRQLLKNLSNKGDNFLVKESCAPFESSVGSDPMWWNNVVDIYENKRRNRGCDNSLISRTFRERTFEIQDVLNKVPNSEAFVYRAAIPFRCEAQDQKLFVPPFKYEIFPSVAGTSVSPMDIGKKILELNQANKLAQISVCTLFDPGSKECLISHSVVIAGVKQVANEAQSGACGYSFKVLNSGGNGWQNKYNGGWVNGCDVIHRATQTRSGAQVSWIDSPNGETSGRTGRNCSNSIGAEQSKVNSIVQPLMPATVTTRTDPLPRSYEVAPSQTKKIYYKCDDGGYHEHLVPGRGCVAVEK